MAAAWLLDVNVLLALLDSAHIHHHLVLPWFVRHRKDGWATCAVTENGFIRVRSGRTYPNGMLTPEYSARHLRELKAGGQHEYWGDGPPLSDSAVYDLSSLLGSQQITDVYLAGLAHVRGSRLVTLDGAIPWRAIRGANAELVSLLGLVH